MASRQELNNFYRQIYGKDFPNSTLSKWKKEGKIQTTEIPKTDRKGSEQYSYNLEQFKTIVLSDEYQKKVKAKKECPEQYIGKMSGYLLITGIVPKNESKESSYKGTLMYCRCLKCGRQDLIQVRFSYLTPNGNYQQTTCGCGRKERAFLASTRQDLNESFIAQFSDKFDQFLILHKLLIKTTDNYYSHCPLSEYEQAIIFFINDKQFNAVYRFWLNHQNDNITFYDWAKPSLDHKTPRSKGGLNTLDNLQVITVFENLSKRDMTLNEWNNFKQQTHTTSDYFIESILNEDRGEGSNA